MLDTKLCPWIVLYITFSFFKKNISHLKVAITAWKMTVFGVILVRIKPECGKVWTRITPNTDTFYAVYATPGLMIAWKTWKTHNCIKFMVYFFTLRFSWKICHTFELAFCKDSSSVVVFLNTKSHCTKKFCTNKFWFCHIYWKHPQ